MKELFTSWRAGDGRAAGYSIIALGLLFLFFFQLLADFIAAIYAFGLLSVSLPAEVACALLLLAPVVLILWRKGVSGRVLAFLGALVLLSRVAEPLLDTRSRMFVSGLGVAGFLIFFPAFLWGRQREADGQVLGISLGLGVLLSILLRTAGSGVDLSTLGMFQGIGWVLAILCGVCLFPVVSEDGRPDASTRQPGDAGAWKIIGLSVGMAAVILLLYFAFTSPVVIARWTGTSYPLVLIVLLLALGAFVWVLSARPAFIDRLTRITLLAWNALFVLCLTLTLLAHQVRFPPTPDGYPFASDPLPLSTLPLTFMLLLSPIVLVDFTFLSREIIAARPSVRLLGGSFTLGALFILLMIFAQVFTTVYDYIPVIGPLFRDRFWLIFLADGTVLTLSMLLVRKTPYGWAGVMRSALPAVGAVIIALGTTAGAWLTVSRPPAVAQPADTLRVFTFNIQQGYNREGQADLEGQLALMRQADADIIGLQECDTTRVAIGNIDVVRYFADRLNMYSYYGPNTTVGTFGVALLSRYPIQNPRTFYMYSLGEQTAAIEAQITVGGRTFNVYVTHLGNNGPIVPQEQVLQLIEGKENVLLMGDFNFRSDTEQYRLTTGTLGDAWLLAKSQLAPSQAEELERRIDYLYVSPGTIVIEAQYLTGPQSDHPALVAEIGF